MIPAVLVTILLGNAAVAIPASLGPASPASPVSPAAPPASDRAIAFGLLVDSPPPPAVIDEAIAIADRLRRAYGIDTGDVLADREAAARRAAADLEALAFGEGDLARVATELGYDLRPGACRTTCRDIRALAETELRKRALLALLSRPPEVASEVPCP
jgi:hypothetical protein